MEVFTAAEFYKIARALERMGQEGPVRIPFSRIGQIDIFGACSKLGLTLSLAQMNRISREFEEYNKKKDTLSEQEKKRHSDLTVELTRGLQERIQDEMNERLFLYVPSDDAELYKTAESYLEKPVIDKWPNLIEDSSESVKCFALSRYTACIFHLMRVMEFGVQKLGDKLTVKLTEELYWQTILDRADKAIRALDQKAEETKKLASVSANLYNVKLAWRNEVMHPKATYTKEEAKRVLDSVQSFMAELASVA
jgi:hypothetical protein